MGTDRLNKGRTDKEGCWVTWQATKKKNCEDHEKSSSILGPYEGGRMKIFNVPPTMWSILISIIKCLSYEKLELFGALSKDCNNSQSIYSWKQSSISISILFRFRPLYHSIPLFHSFLYMWVYISISKNPQNSKEIPKREFFKQHSIIFFLFFFPSYAALFLFLTCHQKTKFPHLTPNDDDDNQFSSKWCVILPHALPPDDILGLLFWASFLTYTPLLIHTLICT